MLALLLAMGGAWAQGPTAAEINYDLYSGWTSIDERLFKASELPGFQAVTEDQAKSWTGVPSTGIVVLYYKFVADGHVKYVIFEDGVYEGSYEDNDLRCYDIYEDIEYNGYKKYFYTTGGGAIKLTPDATGKVWTLDETPDYNLDLNVVYYQKYALKDIPANWQVKVDGVDKTAAIDGDSLKITETAQVLLTPDHPERVKKVILVDEEPAPAAPDTAVAYSFDNASSPSMPSASRVGFDYAKTSVITNTAFLNAFNNQNGDPSATSVSLGTTNLSDKSWTLSFEWAACGGCNSKPDHTTLKSGSTTLFDFSGNSNWNTTVTIIYSGSDGTKTLPVPGCDKDKRFTDATGNQLNTTAYWHHVVITGGADGVKMTITNSSTGTTVVQDVVLSATNVNPTELLIEPCCGGAIGIDELLLIYTE